MCVTGPLNMVRICGTDPSVLAPEINSRSPCPNSMPDYEPGGAVETILQSIFDGKKESTWRITYPQWSPNKTETFDGKIIDGIVNLVGAANRAFAALCALFDKVVVDGLVNLVAMVSQAFGAASRLLQTGRVQQYAAFAVGGSLLAAAWLILS